MSSREHLTDLLVRWQEELDQGRDVPATELCQDEPELLPELAARLADLRRLTLLVVEISQSADPTNNAAASTESFPRTPHSTACGPRRGVATSVLALAPRPPGYDVLEELGRGGMGVVYKARDLALKRIVALKMLRYGDNSSAEDRDRFRRESEAIARLHHPHIVQVFQAGECQASDASAPLPFFVMEYIAGGTLANVARQGPLAPADAARLVMLLARAVHTAHQAGVIHRDLKPGNVLLAAPADEPALNTPWGCPKVSDFGLARLGEPGVSGTGGQTVSGALLGTPAYMAPEQAEGRTTDIGPATDVWALGVILYELLTGHRPFKSESSMATLQKVCTEEPASVHTLRPEVPEVLAAVVERCLRKKSAERYPTSAALADDLKRWLADEAPAWEPAPGQTRRKPIGLGASVAGRSEPASLRSFLLGKPISLRASVAAGVQLGRPDARGRRGCWLSITFVGVMMLTVLGGGVLLLQQSVQNIESVAQKAFPPDELVLLKPIPKERGPMAPKAFNGWIDILVSEPNNMTRQLLRLHEPGARPVRPGDEVRVEVVLKEQPGYVYVLWIDARGKVIPIYPWQDYDWRKRPAQEQPVAGTLMLPADGTGYSIEPGPEGLETLMVLVRETPLPATEELSGLLGDLGEQTGTDREYVRWFENGRVVTSEPDRSPGGKVEASDRAERTQAQIKERLGKRFAFSRAVSFFNVGQR